MQVTFGSGSYASTQSFSWDMWYPWAPFHQTYQNEPGVLVHLSPTEAGDVNAALNDGAAAVGGAFGGVLGAAAAAVAQLLEHLAENSDGSLDIRFSMHGFDCGNLPAGDPTVWIDGAWQPVMSALNAMFGGASVPAREELRKAENDEELQAHRGQLLSMSEV
jgi:hypothetical protein